MIHDEGRLNHMLFAELFEEEVQDIALAMAFFISHVVRLCSSPGFLHRVDLVEVHTGVLLHGVHHGDPGKGLAQVHFDAVIHDLCGSQHFLGHIAEHVLGQVHHAVIIGIGLIQFHEGEFRIVAGVQALIPENTADLVDPLQAADDQALQVQLQGDAQFEVFIQRVEVRFKGTGSGAAGIGNQHGRFHFHEALAVQVTADGADDLGPLDEGILHFRIHDQVHIPLAVAHIGIGEAVILLRQDLQALAQQGQLAGMDGDFSGLGLENLTLQADDIADVHLLEVLVGIFTDGIPGHIALDAALQVLDVAEGSFTHDAFGHHPAGDGNFFAFQLVIIVPDITAVMRHVILGDDKGIPARCLQFRQLVPADLEEFVQVLNFHICHISFIPFLYSLN